MSNDNQPLLPGDRALPTVGVTCRDYQHSWAPSTGGKEKGGWYRTLVCNRCTTERREHLDKWGYVTSRSYKYPEGFLVEGGGGPLSQDERGFLRIMNINPDAKLPRQRRPKEPGEEEIAPTRGAATQETTAKKAATRTVKPAGPSKTARLDTHLKKVKGAK